MMDLTYISSIAGKESVDDFLKECQHRVRGYIRKHYGSAGGLVEDIEQRVMELLFTKDLPAYDSERSEDVWMFIMSRVVYNSANALHELSSNFGVSSDTIRKAKLAKRMIEDGMPEDEVMEALKIGKNTLSSYLTLSQSYKSMDAEDLNGKSLYSIKGKEDKLTDDCLNMEEVLSGLTEEQAFIIEEYLKQKRLGTKAWKRETIAACQERGLTKKRINDVIDEFRRGKSSGKIGR